jgi:hypothetical protein
MGGAEALSFLAQQTVATLGTAVLTYPVYLNVEVALRPSGDALVSLWRWAALLLPMIVGFGIGFGAERIWPKVYRSGQFVWVLPVIWFFWMFARTLSDFPFSKSVDICLADAGGLEMTIGACCYSVGVIVAHRRGICQNAALSNSVSQDSQRDMKHTRLPRINPFV